MAYAHSVRPEQQPQADVDMMLIPRSSDPTHAERAKTLVHANDEGFLSTIGFRPQGYPFGSVVRYALTDDGSPLLCLSQLAEHTKNLLRDPKASLMVSEEKEAGSDPLAHARVTLVGNLISIEDAERKTARDIYIEKFSHAYYVDFEDFDFYQLKVQAVRYIGGFGMMSWVKAEDYLDAEPDPLRPSSRDIIEHMNQDHAEALVLLARAFTEIDDATAGMMTAVDRYGFDVLLQTEAGNRAVRIPFTTDVTTPDASRVELIAMLKDARKKLGIVGTASKH